MVDNASNVTGRVAKTDDQGCGADCMRWTGIGSVDSRCINLRRSRGKAWEEPPGMILGLVIYTPTLDEPPYPFKRLGHP